MASRLLTNTWTDALEAKPWAFRMVIVRFDDNSEELGMWNGNYWASSNGIRQIDTHKRVVAFYIFERFNKNLIDFGYDN